MNPRKLALTWPYAGVLGYSGSRNSPCAGAAIHTLAYLGIPVPVIHHTLAQPYAGVPEVFGFP